MLNRLGIGSPLSTTQCIRETRYDRDEEEDMKTALGLLYNLKKELDKLHPNCLMFVERVIQADKGY